MTRLLAFDPRSLCTISIRHSFAIVVSLERFGCAQFQFQKDQRNVYFDILFPPPKKLEKSIVIILSSQSKSCFETYYQKVFASITVSNKLSSFKFHESNYIYAKFRIKLQQVLIYIEPVYMARVIYWTCFAIKRDCLITDATNSESTRPLIPSSRGQIPRNQPFTYVYTSSPFFYHPLKSTIRFLKISYLFPFRFHLWNGK